MFKRLEFRDYLKILIIVIIVSITIITSKYIGLFNIISKLIKSLFPILFAIAISFINEPLIEKLSKIMKRKFSVILIYVIEIIIVTLIMVLILPSLVDQLKKFFVDLPSFYESIISKINYFSFEMDLGKTINSYSTEILGALSNIINVIIDIGIAYVGGFFLSFDFLKLKKKVKDILIERKKEKIIIFIKNFSPFIYKYTYCLFIDMAILWLITGISFWIIGLEYPFMFGTIIALCDLIPFIGPIIGGAPAVIAALTISFKFALFVLIIIVIAQFIESNITKPFIMKNAISLHPIEGLIGIAIGGSLFGFLGLILSPVIITSIKIYINLKKEEKI